MVESDSDSPLQPPQAHPCVLSPDPQLGPSALTQDSRINTTSVNASTFRHSNTTDTLYNQLPLISSSEIEHNTKQTDLCDNGSDQFPVNKGDIRLASDIIQALSARVPTPRHQSDTNSDLGHNKSKASWYQQVRRRTHVHQPEVHRHSRRLPINQEPQITSNRVPQNHALYTQPIRSEDSNTQNSTTLSSKKSSIPFPTISDPENLQTQKVLLSRKGEPLEINTQNFAAVKQAGQQAN
ncbi:hypothetical protein Tco_0951348 [Tanacetum coccineum]|uniref:Uncharacterized protein n=1 Tax=Tanacetum coccineum TaxID=301880 RepID=A0ABQ5DVM7_9ASTR